MPGVVVLPSAPNTGLSRLGDVILGVGANRAQQRREDELEARRRQQRLADVASERAYAQTEGDRTYGRGRQDRLADVASERAYSEQQRRETAAIAQKRLNQLVAQQGQLQAEGAQLASVLSDPEPVITQQEIGARSLQLAQAVKPGKMPSALDIAAMEPQARQEIATAKLTAWNQQRQDAIVMRSILADRLRDVSAEINTLTNRFGAVGLAEAQAAAAPAANVQRPDLAAAQKTFVDGLMANRTPQPTPDPAQSRVGGLVGALERMAPTGPLITAAPSALADVVNAGVRGAQGLASRVLTGEESTGPSFLERAGTAFGGFMAGDPLIQTTEDRILIERPYSPEAIEIKRRRALRDRQNAQRLSEPGRGIATPTETFPAMGRLLDPVF